MENKMYVLNDKIGSFYKLSFYIKQELNGETNIY